MISLAMICCAGFICGIIFVPVCKHILKLLLSPYDPTIHGQKEETSSLYNLQHGILNLKLPPTSMLMNVGFWKDQETPEDLPKACQALLRQVLLVGGLLEPTTEPGSHPSIPINLLDVGFGCGDQTISLIGGIDSPNRYGYEKGPSRLSISKYVGITKSKEQFSYSRDRLVVLGFLNGPGHMESEGTTIELFCEDAAQPAHWTTTLQTAVQSLRAGPPGLSCNTWILGLDTFYHFAPSRLPLFDYAHNEIRASLMAFDFILPDNIQSFSFAQRLLLRLVCGFTATPYSNLMTQKQYRQMLIKASYSADNIEFQDISADVFGPLASFMSIQDSRLRAIGRGIGSFHVARAIFSWWARSGIVRGCIIVAKHEKFSRAGGK